MVNLFRCGEIQRRVRSSSVVHANPVHRGLPGLLPICKIRIQPIFLFQNPVDSLGYSILRAMVLFGHAHDQARLLDRLNVRVGRILASSIGVVDRPGGSFEPLQRHRQRFEHLLRFQRFAQMVTNDFSRPAVSDQGQIQKGLLGPNIGSGLCL